MLADIHKPVDPREAIAHLILHRLRRLLRLIALLWRHLVVV